MNNTLKRTQSFPCDIPAGSFNTRKRRWEDNSVITALWHQNVCWEAAGVQMLAYMCAHLPSSLRSPTRRGRWLWRWRCSRCQDPDSPERGWSRRCSGWPGDGQRTERRGVSIISSQNKGKGELNPLRCSARTIDDILGLNMLQYFLDNGSLFSLFLIPELR